MGTLAPTLIEFLFRLGFGLALAMLITSSRDVTSGFFRIQSWVLMGLATLASLVLWSQGSQYQLAAWSIGLSVAAAVLAYVSAVVWMYEARIAGKVALGLIVVMTVLAELAATWTSSVAWSPYQALDFLFGGGMLGLYLAAMLLGHWYLNFPGMPLAPLNKLVAMSGGAAVVRILFCASCLVQLGMLGNLPGTTIGWSLLAFRWLAGLVCPLVMAVLAWQTLKIPNTQSATGILYAAVTLVFLGELTAQLLGRGLPVPV